MKLKGRTAIVTGAAGGIGLATARRLLEEGANVLLADLKQDKLDAAAATLGQGADADCIATAVCDVSHEDQVTAAVDAAIKRFGALHIVVNNAGLMIFKPLEEQTGADWQRILNVDLLGAFYFIKQSFLKMTQGGAVINVSSVHAVKTEPLVAPYAAAKTALLSLTRSAALEGKPKNIRVNAVLPGAVDTPMLWDNPNVKSGAETINKDEVGTPEDIAAAIAFLASDDSRFIAGAGIRVDGGRLDRL
ncbi:SDR family oxidoreductase [Massilia arenosa]|uniref:SDR family oxidoreductase n=1 Tax=Zemynaea arenosa TaxID=2561931 RepID=A0A4Y9S5N2_9BURK|nr:SDR family NAD(P)-dependent oxidoreductase [Massilia arenosa]TFW16787.1 SDR family oxidoreductase [Massilia arenosa]